MHRDLKTQNIFLTKTNIIKVGDLGIARVLENQNDMASTLIGTPYYMSPELFSNKPYNHKVLCVYSRSMLEIITVEAPVMLSQKESEEVVCTRLTQPSFYSQSDVWALGCCVYEMSTLKHAFNAKDMNSLVYRIVEGKVSPLHLAQIISHDDRLFVCY